MYLQRRSGGVYYFRMVVPMGQRSTVGKREICFSLNTTNRKEARLKSLPFIEKYLLDFNTTCPQDKCISMTAKMKKGIIFSEVYKKYLNERKLSESSRINFNTSVNAFIRICGDKDIRLYTKSDIVSYKDTILKFPLNLKEADRTLPVEKILIKYKDCDKKISATTINTKYIAFISTIFRYAVINDMRTDNPCLNVKVVVGEDRTVKRLPFTIEQIQQNMFGSDLFCHTQDDRKTEYRWIILLGIYTGARMEEIVRLRTSDFGMEEGIPYALIQPHPDEGHFLKNFGSRRRIPLHPTLWKKLELSKFISDRQNENQKYLFPVVNAGKVIAGKKGTQFSKWFARWLDSVGLKDSALCFHSFRHTLKAWGRGSGVEAGILDALQGHASKSVSMDYGRDKFGSPYPLKVLFDAVVKIDELAKLEPCSN